MSKRAKDWLTKWRIRRHGSRAEKIIADLEDELKEEGWNIPCRAYDFLRSALIVKLFHGLPEVFRKKLVERLAKKSADKMSKRAKLFHQVFEREWNKRFRLVNENGTPLESSKGAREDGEELTEEEEYEMQLMKDIGGYLDSVVERIELEEEGKAKITKSKCYDSDREAKPPLRVDIVDLFQGHDEYGYDKHGEYQTLEEAIAVARELTEKGIEECKSKEEWRMFGIAGLVYDSNGLLVWDGVREYTKQKEG